MPRTRKHVVPFPPYMTLHPDGIEKRYIRLGNSQMLSEAMNSLTHSAFRMYVYMVLEAGGKKEFTMPRQKYKQFMSSGGATRAIKELVAKGFIVIVRRNRNLRQPNIYMFSDQWKTYKPETCPFN